MADDPTINAAELVSMGPKMDALLGILSVMTRRFDELAQSVSRFGKQATDGIDRTAKSTADLSAALAKTQAAFGAAASGAQQFGFRTLAMFATAKAAVEGYARAGFQGTAQAEQMQLAFAQLSREVTAIFLPTFERITKLANSVTEALRGLTGAQQDQIRRWGEAGLVVVTLLTLLPKLVGGFMAVTGSVLSLASATTILDVVTGGILPLVGALATALVAVGAAGAVGTFGLEGIWDTIKPVAEQAMASLKQLAAAVLPIAAVLGQHFAVAFALIAEAIGRITENAGPQLNRMITRIADAFNRASPVMLGLLDAVLDLVVNLVPYFLVLADAGVSAFVLMTQASLPFVNQLVTVIRLMNVIVSHPAFRGLFGAITGGLSGLGDAIDQNTPRALTPYTGDDGRDKRAVAPGRVAFEGIDAAFKRIQIAGLKVGKSPEEKTEENTKKAADTLKELLDAFRGFKPAVI